MIAHADTALPDDPAALVAMIVALRGELTEAQAARRTAELGLQVKTLEAEKLRAQIARLRRQQYGRSSERLTGEIEQLELRLDEVLADIAATAGTDDGEDVAASAVRWVQAVSTAGTVEAKLQGGDTRSHRIEAFSSVILRAVAAQKDISLVELAELLRTEHGASFGASTVWRCLDRHGMTFKKNSARSRAGTARRRRPAPGLVFSPT